jgi:hypothetical protein
VPRKLGQGLEPNKFSSRHECLIQNPQRSDFSLAFTIESDLRSCTVARLHRFGQDQRLRGVILFRSDLKKKGKVQFGKSVTSPVFASVTSLGVGSCQNTDVATLFFYFPRALHHWVEGGWSGEGVRTSVTLLFEF